MISALDTGLLLLRVATGVTLAAHGYVKLFRGGRLTGTARWFDSIGMRPGRMQALLAAITEIAGGILFALGFLTPLAAAAIVALMIVAAWTSHRDNGFFIVGNGWEYNFVLAVVALSVAATGPGAISLDHVAGFGTGTWLGTLVALSAGVVAGIGQLAMFYRPPAAATESTSS
ncbi:DoxX family protein (plasmid) [Rhodococcus sp. DMU1]|nr:DoxX family protein [Rhodococcus sp. DMU1]